MPDFGNSLPRCRCTNSPTLSQMEHSHTLKENSRSDLWNNPHLARYMKGEEVAEAMEEVAGERLCLHRNPCLTADDK